jgi:hypothetical protein
MSKPGYFTDKKFGDPNFRKPVQKAPAKPTPAPRQNDPTQTFLNQIGVTPKGQGAGVLQPGARNPVPQKPTKPVIPINRETRNKIKQSGNEGAYQDSLASPFVTPQQSQEYYAKGPATKKIKVIDPIFGHTLKNDGYTSDPTMEDAQFLMEEHYRNLAEAADKNLKFSIFDFNKGLRYSRPGSESSIPSKDGKTQIPISAAIDQVANALKVSRDRILTSKDPIHQFLNSMNISTSGPARDRIKGESMDEGIGKLDKDTQSVTNFQRAMYEDFPGQVTDSDFQTYMRGAAAVVNPFNAPRMMSGQSRADAPAWVRMTESAGNLGFQMALPGTRAVAGAGMAARAATTIGKAVAYVLPQIQVMIKDAGGAIPAFTGLVDSVKKPFQSENSTPEEFFDAAMSAMMLFGLAHGIKAGTGKAVSWAKLGLHPKEAVATIGRVGESLKSEFDGTDRKLVAETALRLQNEALAGKASEVYSDPKIADAAASIIVHASKRDYTMHGGDTAAVRVQDKLRMSHEVPGERNYNPPIVPENPGTPPDPKKDGFDADSFAPHNPFNEPKKDGFDADSFAPHNPFNEPKKDGFDAEPTILHGKSDANGNDVDVKDLTADDLVILLKDQINRRDDSPLGIAFGTEGTPFEHNIKIIKDELRRRKANEKIQTPQIETPPKDRATPKIKTDPVAKPVEDKVSEGSKAGASKVSEEVTPKKESQTASQLSEAKTRLEKELQDLRDSAKGRTEQPPAEWGERKKAKYLADNKDIMSRHANLVKKIEALDEQINAARAEEKIAWRNSEADRIVDGVKQGKKHTFWDKRTEEEMRGPLSERGIEIVDGYAQLKVSEGSKAGAEGATRTPAPKVAQEVAAQGTPKLRERNGNVRPPGVKSVYEKERPVVGDTFRPKGDNVNKFRWTVDSVELMPATYRQPAATKISLSHENGTHKMEVYTEKLWESPKQKEPWEMTWEENKAALRNPDIASQVARGESKYEQARVAYDDRRAKISSRVKAIAKRIERLNPTGDLVNVDSASKRTIETLTAEWNTLSAESKSMSAPIRAEFVNAEIPKTNAARGQYEHKVEVQKALAEGKPVPAEVLADYPDLAQKPLNQSPKSTKKGTYLWDEATQKGILTLNKNADASTVIHELQHHFLQTASGQTKANIASWALKQPTTPEQAEKIMAEGSKNPRYVRIQESFAYATEQSLKGKSQVPPDIQEAMDAYQGYVANVKESAKSGKDKLTPHDSDFDKLMGEILGGEITQDHSKAFAKEVGRAPAAKGVVEVNESPKPSGDATHATAEPSGDATHATTEQVRGVLGMELYEKVRKADTQTIADAQKHRGKATALLQSDKPLTDSQTVALALDMQDALKERKTILDKYEPGETMSESDIKLLDAHSESARTAVLALDKSGSEAGRALRMRQFTSGADYSEMGVTQAYVKATGRMPSTETSRKIAELSARIAELESVVTTKKAASKKSFDEAVKLFAKEESLNQPLNQLDADQQRAVNTMARHLHEQGMNPRDASAEIVRLGNGAISPREARTAYRKALATAKARNTRRAKKAGDPIPHDIVHERAEIYARQKQLAELIESEAFKDIWAEASPGKRFGIGAKEAKDAIVSFVSAIDFSGIRQAKYGLLVNPKVSIRAFMDQFRAIDKNRYNENMAKLQDDAVYWDAIDHGMDLHGKPNFREEAYGSRLIERVPGIGPLVSASDRAYTTVIEPIRIGGYKKLVKYARNAEEKRLIVDFMQILTGRAGRGVTKDIVVSKPGTLALWAASFGASRIQLTPPAMLLRLVTMKAPARLKGALLYEYAKPMATLVGIGYGVAKLTGGDLVTDEESGDFGLVVLPNGDKIDIWSGQKQAARLLLDMKDPGRKDEFFDKDQDIVDRTGQFFENKMNPVLRSVLGLAVRKDAIGQPFGTKEAIISGTPLSVRQTVEDVRGGRLAENQTLFYLAALGNFFGAYEIRNKEPKSKWDAGKAKVAENKKLGTLEYLLKSAVPD